MGEASVRVFIAIPLPAAATTELAALQGVFRALPLEGTWVRAPHLHITLKFLGEVDPRQLDGIIAAIATVARHCRPFSLRLAGIGVFPNEAKPRVLWVGIDDGAQRLKRLHRDLELHLGQIGLPRDVRPLTPHLTLARLKHVAQPHEFIQCLDGYRRSIIAEIEVRQLNLIESRLHPSGVSYATLKAVPFACANQCSGGSQL
jgi:2'-5' RNA ligase